MLFVDYMQMGNVHYYLNIHVGGHFERVLVMRYVGGEVIRIKEDLDTISYFELEKIVMKGLKYYIVESIQYRIPNTSRLEGNLRFVWDDATTIDMLNLWVEAREIDLYVEHGCAVPTVVLDPLMLQGNWDVEDPDFHGVVGVDEGAGGLEATNITADEDQLVPENQVVGQEEPVGEDPAAVHQSMAEGQSSYHPQAVSDDDLPEIIADDQPIEGFEALDEAMEDLLKNISALKGSSKAKYQKNLFGGPKPTDIGKAIKE